MLTIRLNVNKNLSPQLLLIDRQMKLTCFRYKLNKYNQKILILKYKKLTFNTSRKVSNKNNIDITPI